MNVPDEIRDGMRQKLWAVADQIDWLALGPTEKSQRYENWTHDPDVGGVLARFMDVRQVRVYIKDTVMKKYPQARQSDAKIPFQLLSISPDAPTKCVFIRPNGRQLADGRVVCWGRAADWKTVIMAAHERAFHVKGACPFAVVLLQSTRKYAADEARAVVIDAASKLGIQHLLWDG